MIWTKKLANMGLNLGFFGDNRGHFGTENPGEFFAGF